MPHDVGVHGRLRHSRLGRAAALIAATALLGAGCGTTTQVVKSEQRRAHLAIESVPAGAAVYINDKLVAPATPAKLSLPYQTVHKRITPGTKRTGWFLLLTGILGAAAGAGASIWGFNGFGDLSNPDTSGGEIVGKTFAITFGLIAALYGLFGLVGGVYLLSSDAKPREVYQTTPETLKLRLALPGLGARHASLAPGKGLFEPIGTLRYRANLDAWESPELGPALKLTSKEAPPMAAAMLPATKPRAPKRTIIAVFDINLRGTKTLSLELVKRLSDYLAMRLASVPRFKVVPRDQLRKRLAKEKRRSYRKCFDQSCQIEIGKELAAQKTLSTAIVQFAGRCNVTAVVYDLRSASSEGGASASGDCSEAAIVAALERVVKKLKKTP